MNSEPLEESHLGKRLFNNVDWCGNQSHLEEEKIEVGVHNHGMMVDDTPE